VGIYDLQLPALDGAVLDLAQFSGRATLVINVASRCGFTPQYEGLQRLHERFEPRGFSVLGVPCNQFGEQEPGSSEEIQEFCSGTYDVTFPVLDKIDVNGAGADPLYAYLRVEAPGDFGPANGMLYEHVQNTRPEALGTDEIKWNFTKFLVDRDGRVTGRYESTVTPDELRPELDKLLAS